MKKGHIVDETYFEIILTNDYLNESKKFQNNNIYEKIEINYSYKYLFDINIKLFFVNYDEIEQIFSIDGYDIKSKTEISENYSIGIDDKFCKTLNKVKILKTKDCNCNYEDCEKDLSGTIHSISFEFSDIKRIDAFPECDILLYDFNTVDKFDITEEEMNNIFENLSIYRIYMDELTKFEHFVEISQCGGDLYLSNLFCISNLEINELKDIKKLCNLLNLTGIQLTQEENQGHSFDYGINDEIFNKKYGKIHTFYSSDYKCDCCSSSFNKYFPELIKYLEELKK